MRASKSLAAAMLAMSAMIARTSPAAPALTETVAAISPGIVGVGIHQPLQNPPSAYRGTGFVIGDGNLCATNLHVLAPEDGASALMPGLAVFVPDAGHPAIRAAHVVATDPEHDLALLRFGGVPLPALTLAADAEVRPGLAIAFTGFPLGAALGLYPATHAGIVSAVVPIVTPLPSAAQLGAEQIRLRRTPYSVYQLDATAYPGNSGSPVYGVADGRVLGVVNSVFVKGRKETAISAPSGITYAIPVAHLRALLRRVEAGEKDPETPVKP